MRKPAVLLLLILLSLSVTVVPTLAVPADQLTDLAQYFPEDTPVFVAIRTDDAFIDELDAFVDNLREGLPRGALPPTTLREGLDLSIRDAFGRRATFANTIRPWLGDKLAFGLLSLEGALEGDFDGPPPVLIAVSISDRDEAQEFVEGLLEEAELNLRRTTRGAYTVYVPRSTDSEAEVGIAIGDNVLFIAPNDDLLPLNDDFVSLADNDAFTRDISALPASDYNAVLRLDVGDVLLESMEMSMMMGAAMGMPTDNMGAFLSLYENFPSQAMGLTILEGRALTLDVAQGPFDYTVFEDTPFAHITPMTDLAPVDLTFIERVPAGTPLLMQGTQFGTSVEVMLQTMAVTIEMAIQTSMAMNPSASEDVPAFLQDITAGDVRALIDLTFAGMTGLNLTEQVLPLLNGNSAWFVRVLPAENLDFTVDSALVIENTDAAGFQMIYDSIVNALTRYDATFSEEDGAIVLPDVIRGFFPADFPRRRLSDEKLDFLIGLSDDVFAIGTRAGVEFALDGEGDSLADDSAFADAQRFFLPDTESLFYLGMPPILDLIDEIIADLPDSADARREARQVRAVLSVINSLSATGVLNDDGSSVSRLVLTLTDNMAEPETDD